jgi:hypothetical protein
LRADDVCRGIDVCDDIRGQIRTHFVCGWVTEIRDWVEKSVLVLSQPSLVWIIRR